MHEARSRGEDSDRDVVAADVACFLGIMTSNVGDGLEAIEWLRRSTKIFTAALSQTCMHAFCGWGYPVHRL